MDRLEEHRGPISRNTAEHYVWGGNCDGWHLAKQPSLSVIEERMSPGTSEVRHHHIEARQFFYTLSGELTLEVEAHEYRLKAGDGMEVHPGQKHRAINRSDADVRMMVVSHPASHSDRVISGE